MTRSRCINYRDSFWNWNIYSENYQLSGVRLLCEESSVRAVGNQKSDPSPGSHSQGLNRDRWAGRIGSIRLYPGDDSFAKLLKETFLQEAPSTTER